MRPMTMRTGETVPGQLPLGRPFTRADLDALPDDGLRHELIDGVLIVSPSVHLHQRAVVRIRSRWKRRVPTTSRCCAHRST